MVMKMKPYLSTFIMFLLLVDESLAKGGARSSLRKGFYRSISAGMIGSSKWDTTVENVKKQEFSPTPPTKQIKGLSRIKEYFSKFGYLQSSTPFNNFLDHETHTAIKTYQSHFNLESTGDLTNETLRQLSLPRCGVPDVNFHFDAADGNVSWPKAGRRWFSGRNLTYGFSSASRIPANATMVFRGAFGRWARAVAGLNLTETGYDEADLRVGFYDLDEGVEDVVWGESVVRLKNVVGGEIRLDAAKEWKVGRENGSVLGKEGVLDLESAAMHQIGHLLGLDHSNKEDSVMYPYVLSSRERKVELSDSDKENIRAVYSGGNSGYGTSWGVFLGFAYYCMLLLA